MIQKNDDGVALSVRCRRRVDSGDPLIVHFYRGS